MAVRRLALPAAGIFRNPFAQAQPARGQVGLVRGEGLLSAGGEPRYFEHDTGGPTGTQGGVGRDVETSPCSSGPIPSTPPLLVYIPPFRVAGPLFRGLSTRTSGSFTPLTLSPVNRHSFRTHLHLRQAGDAVLKFRVIRSEIISPSHRATHRRRFWGDRMRSGPGPRVRPLSRPTPLTHNSRLSTRSQRVCSSTHLVRTSAA